MSLRGDDDRAVTGMGRSPTQHLVEAVERGDPGADASRIVLDVPLLVAVDHAHRVVAHRPRDPGNRVGYRCRTDDDDGARPDDRLHVDVHGSLRGAGHRHHHPIRSRLRRLARIGANRDQPRDTGPEHLQALLADDLARARPADEAVHPTVGKDNGAVTEMRRDRRPPRHDGGDGKGLAQALEGRHAVEELVQAQHGVRHHYAEYAADFANSLTTTPAIALLAAFSA